MRLAVPQTVASQTAVASTSGRAHTSRCMAAVPPPARCWGARQAAGGNCCPQPPSQQQQHHQQQPPSAVGAARRRHGGRRGPPPARVTNEGQEVRDPAVVKGTALDPENEDWITVDPQNPLPNPQMGDLARTIGLPYEDALFLDDVDAEAQAYWFTEPAEGWKTEKRRLRRLKEVTDQEAEAEDEFRHTGDDGAARTPIAELREGAVLRGTVVANIYYHGAQVDIGAEWDGLLPCQEEQWDEVGLSLAPGTEVEVRVHRLRDASLFRFPIQLAAVDANLAEMIMPPAEHQPPMDLRVMTLRPEEIAARSEGTRTWEAEKVHLELAEDYEFRTGGYVFSPEEMPLTLSPQQQAEMDDVVDRLAGLN